MNWLACATRSYSSIQFRPIPRQFAFSDSACPSSPVPRHFGLCPYEPAAARPIRRTDVTHAPNPLGVKTKETPTKHFKKARYLSILFKLPKSLNNKTSILQSNTSPKKKDVPKSPSK